MAVAPSQLATTTSQSFDDAFIECRDDLFAYAMRITANRADAEDLVQTTYLKARDKVEGFLGRSSLKTWLFTIATNTMRDNLRARNRWRADTQDRCRSTTQADSAKVAHMHHLAQQSRYDHYVFEEHVSYCFTCISKTLPLENQIALLLKEMFGFTIDEIACILDAGRGKTKHSLADARRTMQEIFRQRCSLIGKNGTCYQCSEMSGFVNPEADAQRAAMVSELSRASANGRSQEELLDLRIFLARQFDLNEDGEGNGDATPTIHDYLLQLMHEEES